MPKHEPPSTKFSQQCASAVSSVSEKVEPRQRLPNFIDYQVRHFRNSYPPILSLHGNWRSHNVFGRFNL